MGAICVSEPNPAQVQAQQEKEKKERTEIEAFETQAQKFEEIKDALNQLELDKLGSTNYVIMEEDMNKIMQVIDISKADSECFKVLENIQVSTQETDQDILTHYKTLTKRQQVFLIEYLKVVSKMIELNKDLSDYRTKYWLDSLIKYKTFE